MSGEVAKGIAKGICEDGIQMKVRKVSERRGFVVKHCRCWDTCHGD